MILTTITSCTAKDESYFNLLRLFRKSPRRQYTLTATTDIKYEDGEYKDENGVVWSASFTDEQATFVSVRPLKTLNVSMKFEKC